ncbi:tyrosine-type recombinase/integrase [Vulcaniibacterium gelatinicum]|uniref:tyrosine-type recombinase/integrase n=1 Tax=Vulcaniibacterium gelatinicum TaxID=2598725 RepID=UPI0011CC99E2|nr:site-specific integrase [Vulcaniibacterium gelatinicum]
MATITQRASGRWQARVRKIGGRAVSRTFARRADAEAWARSVELEVERGSYVDRRAAERITLAELLAAYWRAVSSRHKGAPVERYRLARIAEDLGALRLTALTPATVAEWRDARLRCVSPGTVARELGILGAVLSWARRERTLPIPENPVSAIRKPSPPRGRERRLEPGEEARLMAALEDRPAPSGGAKRNGRYRVGTRSPWMRPLVQFALETAMRQGEMLALRWADVDLERRIVRLRETKNGDARTVPLSSRAVAILRGLPRTDSEQVFPISGNAVKLAWRRATARAGLEDLHFHDLRHEATSRLAERLPNVVELAAVTGHRDLRMLARYYHPRAEVLAAKLG